MSTMEIQVLIESLRTLEELIEEAKTEAEVLRDAIKAEMLKRDTEELTAGRYIVRYTNVLSQRFVLPPSKKCCQNCTRLTPNRSAAAASPSAYKKSPMHQPASKSA